jgi:Holliday junction resolvasome RuvABC DNA-binding subunit
MVVELRDRLPKAAGAEATGASVTTTADLLRDDLVSALANLGYHQQAIDKVLDKVPTDGEAVKFEDALRAALRELARA